MQPTCGGTALVLTQQPQEAPWLLQLDMYAPQWQQPRACSSQLVELVAHVHGPLETVAWPNKVLV